MRQASIKNFLTESGYLCNVAPNLLISLAGKLIMSAEKKYCVICAWRAGCQKRYSVATDASGNVHCPDYSRDLLIKDKDIDEAVRKDQAS
ncbi:MAG: hypothetical protein CVU54_06300 [Deltaproteobacteria bacterium HGW-Deltaproteobacteria-12]|nr:MAG: hypothetical protein CVU54_06300 [Deltaproteobacteria bacterium HGW-Deltaproteobacteria-12]